MEYEEYMTKLSEFVSSRIGNYRDRLSTARILHHCYGGDFQSAFSFLSYLAEYPEEGKDGRFKNQPIRQRVTELLECLGATNNDSIVPASREYFGDAFVFEHGLHSIDITANERELMISLTEAHLGDDAELSITSETLRVANGLLRKLNQAK